MRAVPESGAWDFGDFPYGLEFLTMPPVGHAKAVTYLAEKPSARCDADLTTSLLEDLLDDRRAAGLEAPQDQSDERLFWFRWITGHQVTFIIWHLMGRLLEEQPDEGIPDSDVLAMLEAYTEGYSAMLLYSGSCPRSVYESLIRPRMSLQHRGFSGTWAPDFAPVRGLFRGGRSAPWIRSAEAMGLGAALAVNKATHDGIAARLVPGGESLLQQAMTETAVWPPSERTALLYDNFFMTLRAPVGHDAITEQLLHRLKAVTWDVAVNGCRPLPDDDEVTPETLRRADVVSCELRFGDIVRQVGRVSADRLRERLSR
ncbi:hypothetical protein [Streptomyces sp. NPDC006463]|uniref:hypothetical protein n=1 Tax=Streptomyces sp. NPDC006463 TaxID=3364746 RepID=UPI0036BF5C87